MLLLTPGQGIVFFLGPERQFTGMINGLASKMKAIAITHSAKEAPETPLSCFLFSSRQVRAALFKMEDEK